MYAVLKIDFLLVFVEKIILRTVYLQFIIKYLNDDKLKFNLEEEELELLGRMAIIFNCKISQEQCRDQVEDTR
jgi:hypothetical protein